MPAYRSSYFWEPAVARLRGEVHQGEKYIKGRGPSRGEIHPLWLSGPVGGGGPVCTTCLIEYHFAALTAVCGGVWGCRGGASAYKDVRDISRFWRFLIFCSKSEELVYFKSGGGEFPVENVNVLRGEKIGEKLAVKKETKFYSHSKECLNHLQTWIHTCHTLKF